MKKFFIFIAVVIAIFMSTAIIAQAGEIDLLLEKLVQKGVLTAGEAQQIATETKEQVKLDLAQGKSSSVPSWVQNIKMKGDFRLRFQHDHKEDKSRNHQNRGRVRVRLGVDSKVNEKINVGIGLATGKDDATSIDKDHSRSTNQTLGNGFSKHPITLDYAYLEYAPLSWASFVGGKFKNPFWEPADLIWDTDINPEGGAFKFQKSLNSSVDLFANVGALILDEIHSSKPADSSSDDPMLYVGQGGANLKMTETISLKGAISYYVGGNVKGVKLDGTTSTNSNSGGLLTKEFMTIVPAAELKIKEPFKWMDISFLDVPQISFFGEYVDNRKVSKNGTGAIGGMKLGAEKIENKGDWQFIYSYAYLQKDAILDILPDSDRVGGKTGIRAHEAILQYGLGKNTFLSFDYYQGWTMAAKPTVEHLVQVDWNMKF